MSIDWAKRDRLRSGSPFRAQCNACFVRPALGRQPCRGLCVPVSAPVFASRKLERWALFSGPGQRPACASVARGGGGGGGGRLSVLGNATA